MIYSNLPGYFFLFSHSLPTFLIIFLLSLSLIPLQSFREQPYYLCSSSSSFLSSSMTYLPSATLSILTATTQLPHTSHKPQHPSLEQSLSFCVIFINRNLHLILQWDLHDPAKPPFKENTLISHTQKTQIFLHKQAFRAKVLSE